MPFNRKELVKKLEALEPGIVTAGKSSKELEELLKIKDPEGYAPEQALRCLV